MCSWFFPLSPWTLFKLTLTLSLSLAIMNFICHLFLHEKKKRENGGWQQGATLPTPFFFFVSFFLFLLCGCVCVCVCVFCCLFIYNTYYSHATYVLNIVLIWLFTYILTHANYVYTSHACLYIFIGVNIHMLIITK